MAQTGTPSTSASYRDAFRWGILLAAVAVTGARLFKTFRDFRDWRSAIQIDPSAADFYRMEFQVDVIGIAVVMAIGLAAFYLLRSPAKSRQ
jgi:hypothetical protein